MLNGGRRVAHTSGHVRDGVLTIREGELDRVVPVGSSAWERWLEQPGTTAFRFEHGAARFTARRELQRGRWYWYAYRRRGGRLRKAYLGRPCDLTLDRLEEVSDRLDPAEHGPAAPAADEVPAARQTLGGHRHNLPVELSSFLGRDAEIAELQRLLGTTRLLTLTGSGGVGKTRLALNTAAGLLGVAADAVWLVDLAPLSDPLLVPQAVAQAAGVREEPGRPLLATLATALGVGRVLLVLDNCEHLVGACAHLAEELLRACPDLRVLATSREPLGVPGEVAWLVPSLDLPAAGADVSREELGRSPAVQLFVERARAARPGFALTGENGPAVAEICRRLDGIPLAIELAAARVRILAPDEIAARLGDRFRLLAGGSRTAPPRQQTLRAAVDWSYDLLTEPARRLFERLAVFAGGFTLDAAEAVCAGGEIETDGILDLLSRLVDRSLVLAEPQDGPGDGIEATRYRLLETLRAYGADRLAERGEADRVRARHTAWLAEMAEQADRAFRGPEQARWLRWAEREHDNARAALAWALEREEAELAVRLTASLAWSWLVHLRWSEGLDWAQRVLALPRAAPTRELGLLLAHAVELAVFRGDLASNRPSGDLRAVGRWIEECLAIGEALHDDELVLSAYGMSLMVREFGLELEELPQVSVEEAQALARRVGNTWGECRGLEKLARQALRAGDLDSASARLSEAAELARRTGDTYSLALALNELGDVERARGAHPRAGALYEESRRLFADLGLGAQPYLVHNLGYVALAAGDCVGATAHFMQALTQYRRLGEGRGVGECLIGFGAVAAAEGRAADAARLFGAGDAALEELGTQLWPSNRPDFERWLARARRGLAGRDFDRAWADGRLLSLEQAIVLALESGTARAATARPIEDDAPGLTPREREVARLAAQGLTNRQIAEALVITEKTAANHLQRVLDKLDLHSRAQLAARAAEFGLAPAESVART